MTRTRSKRLGSPSSSPRPHFARLPSNTSLVFDLISSSSTSSSLNSDASADATITACTQSLMTLVRELYVDFPSLASPSGLFTTSASSTGYLDGHDVVQSPDAEYTSRSQPRGSAKAHKKAARGVGSSGQDAYMMDDPDDPMDPLLGLSSIIDELEQVADQVKRLGLPRPPSMSPLEWRAALGMLADSDLSAWDDSYDLCEYTDHHEARSRTHTRAYSEESGYVSGSPSPKDTSYDSSVSSATPRSRRYKTGSKDSLVLESHAHYPSSTRRAKRSISPKDLPLPDTPQESRFPGSAHHTFAGHCEQHLDGGTPAGSSGAKASARKGRKTPLKNMWDAYKRPSSSSTTLASASQMSMSSADVDVADFVADPTSTGTSTSMRTSATTRGTGKSEEHLVRRLKSLVFKDGQPFTAATSMHDEGSEAEAVSFLYI